MDKQKVSTLQALERISKDFSVRRRDLSVGGLKDKQGRTEQLVGVKGGALGAADLLREHLGESVRSDGAGPGGRGSGAGGRQRRRSAARGGGELLRLAAVRVPQARAGVHRPPAASRRLGRSAEGVPGHSQRAGQER